VDQATKLFISANESSRRHADEAEQNALNNLQDFSDLIMPKIKMLEKRVERLEGRLHGIRLKGKKK